MLQLCWEEEESCGWDEGAADSSFPSSSGRGSSIGGMPNSSPELQGAPTEKAQNRAGRVEFGFWLGQAAPFFSPRQFAVLCPHPLDRGSEGHLHPHSIQGRSNILALAQSTGGFQLVWHLGAPFLPPAASGHQAFLFSLLPIPPLAA